MEHTHRSNTSTKGNVWNKCGNIKTRCDKLWEQILKTVEKVKTQTGTTH